jgi:hypothetical protein
MTILDAKGYTSRGMPRDMHHLQDRPVEMDLGSSLKGKIGLKVKGLCI